MAEKNNEEVDIIKQLDWEDYPTIVEEVIKGADIIQGFPFLSVSETIKFKTALGREKDFRDIRMLKDYFKKQ